MLRSRILTTRLFASHRVIPLFTQHRFVSEDAKPKTKISKLVEIQKELQNSNYTDARLIFDSLPREKRTKKMYHEFLLHLIKKLRYEEAQKLMMQCMNTHGILAPESVVLIMTANAESGTSDEPDTLESGRASPSSMMELLTKKTEQTKRETIARAKPIMEEFKRLRQWQIDEKQKQDAELQRVNKMTLEEQQEYIKQLKEKDPRAKKFFEKHKL